MADKPTPERLSEAEALGQAIKRLRRRAELTQEKAAEDLGVVVQSWRRYEWGERELGLDKIAEIASVLGVRIDVLLDEAAEIGGRPRRPLPRDAHRPPSARSEPGLMMLPVRDRVQAGAWLVADDVSQVAPRSYPAVRDPRYPNAEQWLSEVVGDSINALHIFEGDLVHVVDAADIGYFPKTGDIVEVERSRFGGQERELTIKEIEVTPSGIKLWPRSTNPRWTEALDLKAGTNEEEFEIRIRALVIAAIRRF